MQILYNASVCTFSVCIHASVYRVYVYVVVVDALLVYHNIFFSSEEVTEVNMKQVTRCGHHDVVIMSVTNTL